MDAQFFSFVEKVMLPHVLAKLCKRKKWYTRGNVTHNFLSRGKSISDEESGNNIESTECVLVLGLSYKLSCFNR